MLLSVEIRHNENYTQFTHSLTQSFVLMVSNFISKIWKQLYSQSNFIKIPLLHERSPLNLVHIFRTPFHKNISGRLLLILGRKVSNFSKEPGDVRWHKSRSLLYGRDKTVPITSIDHEVYAPHKSFAQLKTTQLRQLLYITKSM